MVRRGHGICADLNVCVRIAEFSLPSYTNLSDHLVARHCCNLLGAEMILWEDILRFESSANPFGEFSKYVGWILPLSLVSIFQD